MDNFEPYVEQLRVLATQYGLNLVYAIVTLILGFWIIKVVVRSLNKALDRAKVEESLRKFLLQSLLKHPRCK